MGKATAVIFETRGVERRSASELCVIGDELFDGGVDLLNLFVDVGEALFVLLFKQTNRDRLGAFSAAARTQGGELFLVFPNWSPCHERPKEAVTNFDYGPP